MLALDSQRVVAALAQAPVAVWECPLGPPTGKQPSNARAHLIGGDVIWQRLITFVPGVCADVGAAARSGRSSVRHRCHDRAFITSFRADDHDLLHCATVEEVSEAEDASPIPQCDGVPDQALAPAPLPIGIDLQPLLAHAPAAIAVLIQEGDALIYRFANAKYAAFVGNVDLMGKPLGSAFVDLTAQAPQIRRILRKVAQSGERFEAKEFALTLDWHHDGHPSVRHYDVVCSPIAPTHNQGRGVTLFAYDVSAQVVARDIAEQSGAYFRGMADCLPQIVWTATPQGYLDYYNARWYAFREMSPYDPGAKDWSVIVHPEDAERCAALWVESLRASTPLNMECRFRTAQGHYRWFLIRATPFIDADGVVARWFGSSTDVHDEKSNERTLYEILEAMHDGFFTVDASWTIVRVNARHEELCRMPREMQVGRHFLDLFFFRPSQRSGTAWDKYNFCMNERLPVAFVDFFPEHALWLAINIYPSEDGGLAVFYRDCSAEQLLLRELEAEKQKFEAIFVDSPACMALVRGPTHIFEKANPQYEALLGHRNLLELPIAEAIPEVIPLGLIAVLDHVFATGEPYVAIENLVPLVRRPDGPLEPMYFNYSYSRVADGNGVPYGVYIHAVDVTHQFLARRRVEELAVTLQQAIRSRDEFLSSASHELKTPVTSIKMQLQMTRRGLKPEQDVAPPPKKLAHTLDLCIRQVNRLAALIEDLLDVSRIEAGKMTFDFQPVDVAQLTRDTLEQFAEQLQVAGCTTEIDSQEPAMVTCDSFRIEQVLINLITNVIKYGAKSACIFRVCGTDTGVRITVTDGGMGIAADKLGTIFDRFERAISNHNVSGLGLGLFICSQIVEAHGGKINVMSTLGQGSCFTVDLPAHPPGASPVNETKEMT